MTDTNEMERLLNVFGETLKDLPRPQNNCLAHTYEHLINAEHDALCFTYEELRHIDTDGTITSAEVNLCDYICHQSDVINKLMKALRKAQQEGQRC